LPGCGGFERRTARRVPSATRRIGLDEEAITRCLLRPPGALLIQDQGSKFSVAFDSVFTGEGIRIFGAGAGANAHVVRRVTVSVA
jgi:hypothetical protein